MDLCSVAVLAASPMTMRSVHEPYCSLLMLRLLEDVAAEYC